MKFENLETLLNYGKNIYKTKTGAPVYFYTEKLKDKDGNIYYGYIEVVTCSKTILENILETKIYKTDIKYDTNLYEGKKVHRYKYEWETVYHMNYEAGITEENCWDRYFNNIFERFKNKIENKLIELSDSEKLFVELY